MLGISNIVRFDFPSPPPAQSLSRSLELLFALGAIDEECELTENIGEKISELPLHPFHAKMLLASIEYECVKEVLSVVALLSVRTIFWDYQKWTNIGFTNVLISSLHFNKVFIKLIRDEFWINEQWLLDIFIREN